MSCERAIKQNYVSTEVSEWQRCVHYQCLHVKKEWQIETILLVTSPKITLIWYIHLIGEELLEASNFQIIAPVFSPYISLAVSASTDGLPFVIPQVICCLTCHLTGAKWPPLGVERHPLRWLQWACGQYPHALHLSTPPTSLIPFLVSN